MDKKNEDMIVTLVDENDEKFDAQLLDSMEYDGHIYSFFVPVEELENEEQNVIIMEYTEQGNDVIMEPVDNEVLLNEIFDAYMELDDDDEEEEE